jgi:uncharacterized protein YheU (UPF0270 family)
MIELTEEQRQQLQSGQAVDVTDPQTAQLYVVLRKDVYERVRQLLYDDSEWTEDELRRQLARSAKDNGWDEAGMDDYDAWLAEVERRSDQIDAGTAVLTRWPEVKRRVREKLEGRADG